MHLTRSVRHFVACYRFWYRTAAVVPRVPNFRVQRAISARDIRSLDDRPAGRTSEIDSIGSGRESPTRPDLPMSAIDRFREVVDQYGRGMATDLAFAVVWVTLVEALFTLVQGPQWAYYLFMVAGIVAYFGFFASFDGRTSGGNGDGS